MGAPTIASITTMSALSAKAGTFTYSDSTFNNEDWELTRKNTGYLSGSATVTQINSGVIDNKFLRIVNSVNSSSPSQKSTVWGVHL